jgi:hypothetical protein
MRAQRWACRHLPQQGRQMGLGPALLLPAWAAASPLACRLHVSVGAGDLLTAVHVNGCNHLVQPLGWTDGQLEALVQVQACTVHVQWRVRQRMPRLASRWLPLVRKSLEGQSVAKELARRSVKHSTIENTRDVSMRDIINCNDIVRSLREQRE